MALTHITDHQARALAELISQYQGSVSVRGLISLATAEHQTIEDQFWAMFAETIDLAFGAQLDTWGSIIGQKREGRDDVTYRIWIRARARLNRSQGTAEDIIAVFAALTQGTATIIVQETAPAGITVTVGSTVLIDPAQLSAILQLAKAAGVRGTLISATSSDTTSFAFDPNGAGWGDSTNSATGGTMATVY